MNQADISSLQLDVLYGIKFFETKITVWVGTTGCTRKEDFKVLTSVQDSKSTRLIAFVRVNPDRCLAAPHEVELTFTVDELGLDMKSLTASSITVANPFVVLLLPTVWPAADTPA